MAERNKDTKPDQEPIKITRGVPVPISNFLTGRKNYEIEVEGIPGMEVVLGSVMIDEQEGLFESECHFPLGGPIVRLTTINNKVVMDPNTTPFNFCLCLDDLRKRQFDHISITMHVGDMILQGIPYPYEDIQIMREGTSDYFVTSWQNKDTLGMLKIPPTDDDMSDYDVWITLFPRVPNVLENGFLVVEFD